MLDSQNLAVLIPMPYDAVQSHILLPLQEDSPTLRPSSLTFSEALSTFSAKPRETDMGSGPSTHRCVHLPGGLTAVSTH